MKVMYSRIAYPVVKQWRFRDLEYEWFIVEYPYQELYYRLHM